MKSAHLLRTLLWFASDQADRAVSTGQPDRLNRRGILKAFTGASGTTHWRKAIVFIKITADAKVELNYLNNVYIYPQILGKLSQIYWFYISLHIYFSLNRRKRFL